MPNHVKKLSLTTDEKDYLTQLLRQSTLETRKYLRSRILLRCEIHGIVPPQKNNFGIA